MTVDGDAPAGADDAERLARIEDAGINASAPREQRWIDGWLVRLLPGKANRTRCIRPVVAGRLGIVEKLALCLPLYAAAGLQPYVRITPFVEPPGLDEHLAALGMTRVDDSRVMALASLDDSRRKRAKAPRTAKARRASRPSGPLPLPNGSASFEARRWASAQSMQRASRKPRFPTTPSARGQVAIDGPLAGLYDIFTIDEARGRGHAERICRQQLGHTRRLGDSATRRLGDSATRRLGDSATRRLGDSATRRLGDSATRRLGATASYLQVDAGNDRALSTYRRPGFRVAYSYHYRTPLTAVA